MNQGRLGVDLRAAAGLQTQEMAGAMVSRGTVLYHDNCPNTTGDLGAFDWAGGGNGV